MLRIQIYVELLCRAICIMTDEFAHIPSRSLLQARRPEFAWYIGFINMSIWVIFYWDLKFFCNLVLEICDLTWPFRTDFCRSVRNYFDITLVPLQLHLVSSPVI